MGIFELIKKEKQKNNHVTSKAMITKVTIKQVEKCTGSLEQFGVKAYNARLFGIHYETKQSNNNQLIKLNFDGKEEVISLNIRSKTDFINAVYRDINRLTTKAKKPTKKQIIAELRSLDCTRIHRIASKCGIDANIFYDVINFIHHHAPSRKLNKKLGDVVRRRGLDRFVCSFGKCENNLIRRICYEMRAQIKLGMSAYSKILIKGIEYIYWASPRYGLFDNNKSIAMSNNERNRKIMTLVNNHLAKNGIK